MLVTDSKRGLTLIELLISASILLLITTMVFLVMVPLMRKAQPGDDKQENIQRLIFLRRYLDTRLNGARVLAVDTYGLDYYVPERVDTDLGRLDVLTQADMVRWDYSVRYRVTTVDRGGEMVVVDGPELAPETGRSIWNLGPGGELTFEPKLPLVTLTARSQKGQYGGGIWQRQVDIVIKHYSPD